MIALLWFLAGLAAYLSIGAGLAQFELREQRKLRKAGKPVDPAKDITPREELIFQLFAAVLWVPILIAYFFRKK